MARIGSTPSISGFPGKPGCTWRWTITAPINIPRPDLAKTAPTLCSPLCADQFQLVESGGAVVRRTHSKRIRRGSFGSVAELQQAIEEFLLAWNENPKPFVWTATVESILESSRAAGKRWNRSSRAAPCLASGAPRGNRGNELSSCFVDTTLARARPTKRRSAAREPPGGQARSR